MPVDVKICGLCRPEDASAAYVAGARYAGVVLTAGFARSQTLESAAEIFSAAGDAFRVGVFVDEPAERVAGLARELALDVVQLHGAEGAIDIGALRGLFDGVVWKALRATDPEIVEQTIEQLRGRVDAFLLDGDKRSSAGGVFHWNGFEGRAAFPSDMQLGIAGGLTPANVRDAALHFTPDFVDVSSGVEVTVGRKSPELIRAFIAAATNAAQPMVQER